MFKTGYCPKCNADQELLIRTFDEAYPVRGEKVTIKAEVAFCAYCGEEVFDSDLDSANLERAYAEYRRRNGLLFPVEITALREKYGMGQRTLAKLLGWSPATIYRYEKGAVPAPAHAEILKGLTDPSKVLNLLKSRGNNLSLRERSRLDPKLAGLLDNERRMASLAALRKRAGSGPCPENGFREFDFEKLAGMMTYFAVSKLSKVALMKLLWYADFLHFKKHAVSISGARYASLPLGPALDDWLLCLQSAVDADAITIESLIFTNGNDVDLVYAKSELDDQIFSKEELATLQEVATRFGKLTAKKLTELSHKEEAWRQTATGRLISYEHALSLTI